MTCIDQPIRSLEAICPRAGSFQLESTRGPACEAVEKDNLSTTCLDIGNLKPRCCIGLGRTGYYPNLRDYPIGLNQRQTVRVNRLAVSLLRCPINHQYTFNVLHEALPDGTQI